MKDRISQAIEILSFLRKEAHHGLPSLLLWCCFMQLIWGQYITALLIWILAELVQIKYLLEGAEIIVREED